MVTASKAMSAGQASTYYTRDNYYIKDGITEKGQWAGKAAEELGLKGDVNQKDFVEVLNGYKPGSLSAEQIKQIEALNKTESSLSEEAKKLSKMTEGEEKTKLKEALDGRIKDYNESRLDFHKDVQTGGLHSEIKKLKEMNIKDPTVSKQIQALQKEMRSFEQENKNDSKQLIRDGHDEYGIATHRAGFDFTFSAPKSVSIAALTLGSDKLVQAHQDAMNKAMKFAQSNFAQTRDYDADGERERVNTGNLAVAQFTHYTSRATDKEAIPDPQLHTHNLILNLTKNGEKYMSLEPQQLYQIQKLSGQVYQNELARIVKELGYSIEWIKSGDNYTFEIKGIDKNIRDGYSSRSGQIEAIVAHKEKELGRELSPAEKNNITLDSRVHKNEQNIDKLQEHWDNILNDMGYTKEELIEITKNQTSDKTIANGATEAVKLAIENLHSQKSVFNEREIIHEALKAAQGSASLDEIRSAINSNSKELLVEKTDTFQIGSDKNNKAMRLFSSKEILNAEANIEKAILDGKSTGSIMSREDFAKAFKKIEAKKIAEAESKGKEYLTLTEGQRDALEHIATSDDKYIGIQGDAGSGKTTALERMTEVVEILRETASNNVELIGLAPTNLAAGAIEKDAGIKSQTVDSFMHKPVDAVEGKQQVYLVDESSMLDTVKMAKLVAIAEKTGAKVVFIGDNKQLKPVGAGAMFDRLLKTNQMGFAHVTEVLRQKTDLTKEVAECFKSAETLAAGLDKLENENQLIEAKDGDMGAVREAFVKNAANNYSKEGFENTIALVSTNEDRHNFNTQIRDELVKLGSISKDNKKHKVFEAIRLNKTDSKFAGNYHVGNILVTGKRVRNIKSGTQATILEIDKEKNKLKISYGEGKDKWISANKTKNYSSFQKMEKEFSAGDKIAFEKKDKNLGIQNGETGIIKEIDENGVWQVDKGGKMVSIDPEKYPFMAHGYAMTVHKSQGQSIDNVHIFADSSKSGLNKNAGYVQVTRAKMDLMLYTDSRENLEKLYKREQISENAGESINTSQFSSFEEKLQAAKDGDRLEKNQSNTSIKEKEEPFVERLNEAAGKKEREEKDEDRKEEKEENKNSRESSKEKERERD